MQRRLVVGQLAATVAGLSLGKVSATVPGPSEVAPWAQPVEPNDAMGNAECPQCKAVGRYNRTWDLNEITPAGICLICAAKADPSPTVVPYSDPFWILTPAECKRLEPEMERLHRLDRELNRQYDALPSDWEDSDEHDALTAQIDAVNREALVLHMLYAASRQFAPSRSI